LAVERIFVRTRKLATLLAGAALVSTTTLAAGATPAGAAGPYANTTSWKGVVISRGDGSGKDSDADNYQYYAGPVYVSAPGQCIDVEGISPSWTSVKLNNVHCG
jgi:hypothetical protein